MKGKQRKQIKLGNVYAIHLPNGKYAYGRTFKDGCIAIYKQIGDTIEDLPEAENYQFTVGIYKDILMTEQWPIVDNRPFKDDNEAWPPPMCIIDSISGEYSLYRKGVVFPSSRSECSGLEIAAVWEAEHIIARIMGNRVI